MQFSTTPSVYNEYVVDPSGRAITAIQPGTTNVYTAEVFAGGRHWVTDNGSALFLGTDWLGTTRALTELSGTFAQLYTSLPWGDGLSSGGSSFDTTSQYTGKEYDPESGLYHFPARQYAPVQGRWLTPDPAGISAMRLDSPQSWNRYAYVLNNPLNFTDPTGLYPGGDCDTADPGCSGKDGLAGDDWVYIALEFGELGGSSGIWINFGGQGNGQNGPANNGNQPLLTPQQQKALHCLGQTVKAKGLSIGLDVAGSIPGFGNLFSGAAAGIQGLNAAYYGTVSLANAGNTLLNPSASGAANTAATAGFAVASLALSGSKAIPVVGTLVSLGFLVYDIAGPNGAISTYQQCMAGPG
jgi:RHS repeat-associated protein